MERGRAQTGLRLAGVWLDTKGMRASPPVCDRLGKRLLRDFAHIHCCRSLARSCWAGAAARGWPWRRRRVARRWHCADQAPPGGQNGPPIWESSPAEKVAATTLLYSQLCSICWQVVVSLGWELRSRFGAPVRGACFPGGLHILRRDDVVDRIAVCRTRIWTRKLEECAAYRLMGCSN
jgi:hypothetical protein